MGERKAKLITVLLLLIVLVAVSSCYISLAPWKVMEIPTAMRLDTGALGPLHPWVPETVLYINENCALVDDSGAPATDLALVRWSKVTIWNHSGALAIIDFGDAFAPPGTVRLNPEYGVWRRVVKDAPTSGFEVTVECEEVGDHTWTTYALPDTIVTPPPGP